MTFGGIAVGIGLVVGAGASIYGTATQGKIANQGLSLAEDQRYKQDEAFNQLQELMNNPASFFNSPVYQAAFNQGSQAVARQGAAAFGPNSGNMATELQAYGQSFGQQQLLSQEQLLANMSGTGANPAAGLNTASGAASSATAGLGGLAGLLAFFGTSGMGGGGGGVPANSASMYGTTSGWPGALPEVNLPPG
jgi:hypothetical protein